MHPNRRQMLTFATAFGLATIIAGCASGGEERGPRRDPNTITAEELAPHENLSCLEAVRRLRPRWLQSRGVAGLSPTVIQDGNRMGDADSILEQIRASDVESLKYLNPNDATVRYGTNMTAGVIEVVTRRR